MGSDALISLASKDASVSVRRISRDRIGVTQTSFWRIREPQEQRVPGCHGSSSAAGDEGSRTHDHFYERQRASYRAGAGHHKGFVVLFFAAGPRAGPASLWVGSLETS